ncbi:MAG: arginine N-succinyltransferase [Desulfobulbus sp.]|jgi:hypothetical protein|nr:arginine N-succinyltransferase [Desulfobulbus sp.]
MEELKLEGQKTDLPPSAVHRPYARLSGLQITGIVLGAMAVTIAVTLLVVKSWLFPTPFKPVQLSLAEEQKLEHKLARFEQLGSRPLPSPSRPDQSSPPRELEPEPYSEEGASREIRLSEREINAMIAHNTDLADKVAIDLADDLVSLRMLIPVDPDFPFFGGRILKVRAGAELAFRGSRPVFILRGISVMGVPVPNAWMGGVKDIDLVSVFGAEPGFWKGFADGVAAIQVREGNLEIILRE